MIRGVSYSKPLAAGALAAVAFGGLLFLLRMKAISDLAKQRHEMAAAEGALQTQIAGRSAYESENLLALRRRISRIQGQLGTDGTWESIVRRLGSAWVAEPGPKQDRSGYFLQAGTLTLVAHAVEEWPGIVDAVRDIEAVPGAVISGFEIKASGSGERRSLEKATIQLEIQTTHTQANFPKKT